MKRIGLADFGAAAAALIIVAGFAVAGGTEALGAHPWWAVKVGYIGAFIGVVAWLSLVMLGASGLKITLLAAIALVASVTSALMGKSIFAASYAENALAGRFWFLGWIALAAATTILIATLIHSLFGKRP